MGRGAQVLLFQCCVFSAQLAYAEQEGSDEEVRLGFAIGDRSALHTNIDVAVGYDSNAYRVGDFTLAENQVATEAVASGQHLKFQIRPGLNLDFEGDYFSIGVGGHLSFEHFIDVEANYESSTKVGGSFQLDAEVETLGGFLSFRLQDQVKRTPTFFGSPGTENGASNLGDSEIRNPLWANTGKFTVIVKPGRGALELMASYQNELIFIDDLPGQQSHGIEFEGKLWFLPRTAVTVSTGLSFYDSDLSGAVAEKATPWFIAAGIDGQFTSRLSGNASIGYTSAQSTRHGEEFFGTAAAESQDTVGAGASLTWTITEGNRLTIGYRRHVRPLVLLRSYVGDVADLQFDLGTERFRVKARGQFEARDFAEPGYSALRISLDTSVEYWFFEFLTGALVYQFGWQDASNAPPPLELQVNDYSEHMALALLGFRY